MQNKQKQSADTQRSWHDSKTCM